MEEKKTRERKARKGRRRARARRPALEEAGALRGREEVRKDEMEVISRAILGGGRVGGGGQDEATRVG